MRFEVLLAMNISAKAVPYLTRVLGGFLSNMSGIEPTSGHVGFVVDEEALGQVSTEHFSFP
jgi:hypothetical protein